MFFRKSLILSAFSMLAAGSSARGQLISNGDFSAGLTGYTTAGAVSTAASYSYTAPSTGADPGSFSGGTISPTAGTQVTELRSVSSGNTSMQTLESTLGLANNSLQDFSDSLTHPYSHTRLRGGSALQTSFDGTGTLTFDWNFWREDYVPDNDLSFFTISGPGISGNQIVLLSDVNGSAEALALTTGRGPGAGTGWQDFSYTLPDAGVYTIGFGVLTSNEKKIPSFLHIDNIQLSAVPEVTPSAVLLLFGAVGIVMRRRRSLVNRP